MQPYAYCAMQNRDESLPLLELPISPLPRNFSGIIVECRDHSKDRKVVNRVEVRDVHHSSAKFLDWRGINGSPDVSSSSPLQYVSMQTQILDSCPRSAPAPLPPAVPALLPDPAPLPTSTLFPHHRASSSKLQALHGLLLHAYDGTRPDSHSQTGILHPRRISALRACRRYSSAPSTVELMQYLVLTNPSRILAAVVVRALRQVTSHVMLHACSCGRHASGCRRHARTLHENPS